MKICVVKGCDNKHTAKGYCQKHYVRFKKYGDPFVRKTCEYHTNCKVEGCESPHRSKGYCSKHYRKFKKYGNPLIAKRESHGMEKSSEYSIWADIKKRCINSNSKVYKNYGGRGIKVCDRWKNSFIAFYEDMGLRPFPKAEIDRKDNDGDYCKSNCHWTTSAINCQNKRNNVFTKESVKLARQMYEQAGFKPKQLRKIFGVCKSTLENILGYVSWRNI